MLKISCLLCLLLCADIAHAMTLSSPSFKNGTMIPSAYTCHGENISPHLSWQDVPTGTKTLALIVSDPDAPKGVWDHWLLYNIPPQLNTLAADANLPKEISVGLNSWHNARYQGPCPPSGTHHYIFTLYALDTRLNLPDNSDKAALLKTMQGHVLATATWIGLFSTPKN